jgi:hypothetical protein
MLRNYITNVALANTMIGYFVKKPFLTDNNSVRRFLVLVINIPEAFRCIPCPYISPGFKKV